MADYLLAQTSVLGSMLISPSVAGDVLTQLTPEDFTEPTGQQIYRAIRELYLDGEKIDPVPVLERMDGDRKKNRDYLLAVMDTTPTAQNYREYMAIVKRQSRLRRVQSIGLALAQDTMVLEDVAPLVSELNALMVDRTGVESLSMEQGLTNFYAELDRKPDFLPWGLEFLDEGLTAEQGDLVILGGYPSDGKTALALQMAYHQARKKRVGFFSLETSNSKLFARIFSAAAKVSGARIKHRTLDSDDYYLLEQKVDEIKNRDLHLVKASSMTVADIQAYTRARQFDVIYVDYLTLVNDKGLDEFHKATNISRGLHRLAQDNNVTVIALSQLARPEDKRRQRPPTMQALRSSGQLEQDADIVMLLYREEPGILRSRRILTVAKNKEGQTGSWPLRFEGDIQTFQVDKTGKPIKRAEPEKEEKQQAFWPIPGSEPLPWDEGRE